MGEVYRARDAKLNRDVALKILPDAFAGDPDRLARFTREAQTLASLNHTNIAHIHGLEESGDVRALVMELVEGEDLAQWIARSAIRLDEALPIARQIAEALEAAHEQGIIHRDLKPANIKVRPDGTVKVLDFGLAKAMEPVGRAPNVSQSPTITTPAMTQAGMILGTAAYMSPEQARGKTLDKRTDIWAFGCVLYEMLTGTRAFAGDDVSDVLASVLAKEPDWTRLPSNLSPALGTYIRRCLEKNPKQRIADAQDMRLALEGAFDTRCSCRPRHPSRRARRARGWPAPWLSAPWWPARSCGSSHARLRDRSLMSGGCRSCRSGTAALSITVGQWATRTGDHARRFARRLRRQSRDTAAGSRHGQPRPGAPVHRPAARTICLP